MHRPAYSQDQGLTGHSGGARVAMEVALRLVSGQKLPRVVATPQALITKDNIKEYQSDDVRSVLMKAAGK